MKPKEIRAVVAIYKTHVAAEVAVKELHRLGFDMKKLSIIGRDFHAEEQILGFVNTEDRIEHWGKYGALWGSVSGVLVGSAFLVIPGIGHLVVLGHLVTWIAEAAAGALLGGGLSVVGAVLASVGIPRNSVIKYERAVKASKFLLVAQGTQTNIEEAQGLLATSAELVEIH